MPLFQKSELINCPTAAAGCRDYQMKDHRIEKNNTGSILQKEIAQCKDQPLPIAGRTARLFTEFTLQVPAVDGTGPVDTMVGGVGKFL